MRKILRFWWPYLFTYFKTTKKLLYHVLFVILEKAKFYPLKNCDKNVPIYYVTVILGLLSFLDSKLTVNLHNLRQVTWGVWELLNFLSCNWLGWFSGGQWEVLGQATWEVWELLNFLYCNWLVWFSGGQWEVLGRATWEVWEYSRREMLGRTEASLSQRKISVYNTVMK